MTSFTIIYDTYCGWCYGASPILERLALKAEVEIFHRYLFRGSNAYRMGDGFGTQAAVIDARIEALSGQPFGSQYKCNILQSPDEILESGLSAQAAYLASHHGPVVELELARKLQAGYFVQGRSTQDISFIKQTLEELQISSKDLGSKATEDAASRRADKAIARMETEGVHGVPTVLCHGRSERVLNIAEYYRAPHKIDDLIS